MAWAHTPGWEDCGMKRTLHMNGIAHNNRGQRQKEEMRVGVEKKQSKTKPKQRPLCAIGWRRRGKWMKEK